MPEFRYGDNNTINGSSEVGVEVDRAGRVVSVWFRCMPLKFHQSDAEDSRAAEMRRMYAEGKMLPIMAIVFEDKP